MATSHYKNNIKAISGHFGVSEPCAKYLYHRALRSKCKHDDPKYMQYTVKLQNALVLADKCLGIEWHVVLFDTEMETLAMHGILVDEQNSDVFKWDSSDSTATQEDHSDGWQTVLRKKTKKNKLEFTSVGIYA